MEPNDPCQLRVQPVATNSANQQNLEWGHTKPICPQLTNKQIAATLVSTPETVRGAFHLSLIHSAEP